MNRRTASKVPHRTLLIALFAALSLASYCSTASVAAEKERIARVPVRNETRRQHVYTKSWVELKRQNVVMQQRDFSCGAAALATVIKYQWDGNVTETQLLLETGKMLTAEELKDRIENGLSLTDLRRLSVRVGYLASIGRLTYEKLSESKVPLIVGIVVNGYDHFVVYRGSDCQYVYLADPARGNVRTPIPEFVKQWQKNLVLVVVKKGVDTKDLVTPLTVTSAEKSLGELNRLYARDRNTGKLLPQ